MFNLSTLTRSAGKISFGMKKHSPQILFGLGVAGVIGSGVYACKQTVKAVKVAEKYKEELSAIECFGDVAEFECDKKALTKNYILDMVKLYAGPVVFASLSIGCLATSNFKMAKRNVGLAAGYAALDRSFKRYRQNVIDELGEDADRRFMYGINVEEIEEFEVDKNGKEKKVKKKKEVIDLERLAAPYTLIFDQTTNPNFDPVSDDYNLTFIRLVEQVVNDNFQEKGSMFINEVIDALGFYPECRFKDGYVNGYLFNLKDKNLQNWISFGVDTNDPAALSNIIIKDYDRVTEAHPIIITLSPDGCIINDLKWAGELRYH